MKNYVMLFNVFSFMLCLEDYLMKMHDEFDRDYSELYILFKLIVSVGDCCYIMLFILFLFYI